MASHYLWLDSVCLVTTMEVNKARRKPIDTIPPEVLLLIFEEYCRAEAPLEASTSPECLVTHICQYWRSLAVNLPTLWTKLRVTSKTPLPILSLYFERSKDLPLNIEIDLQHDLADEVRREYTVKLWEVVKSTICRWRRLKIHIGTHDATSICENLRRAETPFLDDVHMSCDAPVDGLALMFGGRTPSLRSLRLSDVSLLQFTPSLGQITRLNLSSSHPMQFSVFQEIMSQMVELKELTLRNRVVEGWPLDHDPENMITIPSLTTFKFSDRRTSLFVPLLSISAPILHSLSLYDLVGHDLPDTTMEHHIVTQYPSVRNLTLKGKSSFIDEISFCQLARMFPAVDHIALLGVDSAFISESCHTLHEPALWPKLRTLSMTPMVAESILCSLIAVRSRSAKQIGLKRLVGPMPTKFKRMDWISQRVKFEECHDTVSENGHLHNPSL